MESLKQSAGQATAALLGKAGKHLPQQQARGWEGGPGRSEEHAAGGVPFPTVPAARHPTESMLAFVWEGKNNMKVESVPRVALTDPGDALVKITSTTICGSDLHLVHGDLKGLGKGAIIGHEAMGVIEALGSEANSATYLTAPGRRLKVGDRVVISAVIACGACGFCTSGRFSLCDHTNSSTAQDLLYGARTGALFGYTQLLGSYEGLQAEWGRVPLAHVNLLPVDELSDEQALLLSDVLCTAWHANELGEVKEGDTVAILGAGPIGLATSFWAKFRGAKRVVVLDKTPYRLAAAAHPHKARADATINVTVLHGVDAVVAAIQEAIPGGPDVVVDATGFRMADSLFHRVQRELFLETDTPEHANTAIRACKKGGHVVLIADYVGYANGFALGHMMEKGLTVRGGQLWPQKYWPTLAGWIKTGAVDPTWLFTHTMRFEDAQTALELFDQQKDGALKILLKTKAGMSAGVSGGGGGSLTHVGTGSSGSAAGSGSSGGSGSVIAGLTSEVEGVSIVQAGTGGLHNAK